MKGIVLSGGLGTRLRPLTTVVSKQLLPVYDRPMVMHPIMTLLHDLQVDDLLVITNPEYREDYLTLLGEELRASCLWTVVAQPEPGGIAQALLVADDFGWLRNEPVYLILGDNVFHSSKIQKKFEGKWKGEGACVVLCTVRNPQAYGVAEYYGGKVLSIEEKPATPRSPWAVTGLYAYDNTAVSRVRSLQPSARGELEITDLNNLYLADGQLNALALANNDVWFDCGTADSLLEASNFFHALAARRGP